jgi:hypothetical protein
MRGAALLLALLISSAAHGQAFNVGRGLQIKPGVVKPIATSGYGILWISSADSLVYYTNAAGSSLALSTLQLSDLGGLTLSAGKIYKTGEATKYISWNTAGKIIADSGSATFEVSTALVVGGNFTTVSDNTYSAFTTSFRGKNAVYVTAQLGGPAADKPTCDSGARGKIFVNQATGGNSDTVEACVKAAADTYAWLVVATAP